MGSERMDAQLSNRMREDWNRRAREDAGYYVAFGRRGQSEDEFLATGTALAGALVRELKRLAPAPPRTRRALEIGCGLGRLLRPLSRHFGEIHGVDVSDEMVRLAREALRDIPHAHVHATGGADLAAFADESFDFVYSYAVFQHIPSREVVFSYLGEARRVLKEGGVLRFQANGLPENATRYDTWHGVRIAAGEIAGFARENGFQLLAMDGAETQYLWATLQKQPEGWRESLAPLPDAPAHIRRITNALTSERLVPSRGRFAVVSLWLEDLPADCDLIGLEVRVAGEAGRITYLGPPEADGLRQLNAALPAGVSSALHQVEVFWLGAPLAPPATLRVVPPAPLVPRIVSVSDGVDLLSSARITSRVVKVVIEEAADPGAFRAAVDGHPAGDLDIFCVDPVPLRFEINFPLPDPTGPGPHRLEMQLGARRFAPVAIEVA
jgi:ubiquinone/menaquinone biosynthesis C-methylase UbiE